ncbi:unnamed protein product [Microthlaspi erraticum]|uniref:Uncharacterized protein n=1 Tax=Microthlaspi erraticum TaxID=1685480 RepID=A0A6D2K9A5_9BRAS|nr:unnamed protein product [Microthlaspi erraticum]
MGFESFANKYGGITTFLRVYSTQQYTSSSALAKDLGFRLLTVLLLYFNMDAPNFSNSKYLETGRKVAGWAGLIFATVSLFDAALRPKYKGLRLLDELSILCLFTAIFALFCWLFKRYRGRLWCDSWYHWFIGTGRQFINGVEKIMPSGAC